MINSNNNIPQGWTIAKLGELVLTEKGKKPKRISKEKTNECFIPYVNIKAFEKNIIDEYTDGVGCVLCEDDDFLMVWDGSRSGYVGKAIKGALGSTLVRIKLPLINQDLTYYFLKSKFIEINSRAKGVGIPHVDPNLLWNYDFPLAPLNEQARILAKLEQLLTDLDKGIEYLETTKQQLKVYRQAVLKWAFEGKLTQSGFEEIELRSDNLGAYIERIEAGKSFKCEERPPSKSEYGVLKVSAVTWGKYDENKSKTITDSRFVNENFLVRTGDFIFSRANTLDLIGAVVIAKSVSKNVMLSDKTLRIIFSKHIVPEYALYYLRSKEGRKQIQFYSNGNQESMRNIGQTGIKNISIPIPKNTDLQTKIVSEIESRLSVCDKIEETIESSLQQAEALRLSIIKQAFEGKLVPQDPSDEPAEKLLERIRALRQSSTKLTSRAQGKQGAGKPEKKEKVKTIKNKVLVNG